jgi:hypothetical protein
MTTTATTGRRESVKLRARVFLGFEVERERERVV